MKWLVAAVALSGCGVKALPDAFVFGATTAGFRDEPGCPTVPADQCEDRASDWAQWFNQPLGNGPGEWELFEPDFDLVRNELGLGTMHISLEWSRIFPSATDGLEGEALRAAASEAAVDRYHSMFAAMKARGLTPLVTLNHTTLPAWLHDAVACRANLETCVHRGWLDHDRIVTEISKYAAFCAREFGAEVDWWATINEPFSVVLNGYVAPREGRVNPPGVSMRAAEAKEAMRSMIDAHARMWDAINAADVGDADLDGVRAKTGLMYEVTPVSPKDPTRPLDVQAAKNLFYLYNTAFLDSAIKGTVDLELDGTPDPKRLDLPDRVAFLGVSYRATISVSGSETASSPAWSALTTFDPATLEYVEDSRGVYDALTAMQQYSLPLYATTGGDAKALVDTMAWLGRALQDGADVRGYFAPLLESSVGLYEVGADKSRTPRETATAYRDRVKSNRR